MDLSLILSLLSGVISGILATWIFWWYNNIYLSPKIVVSKDIGYKLKAEIKEITENLGDIKKIEHKTTVYKIKISNETGRDAYDIRVFIRIYYNGTYAILQLPYVPIIHGKTEKYPFINEREFPFCMTDMRLSKVESFEDPKILDKYKSGNLILEDFNDKDTLFEIIIFATDSKSGAITRLNTIKRSYKELLSSIKEGDFVPGTLKVINKQSKEGRPYDYNNQTDF